MRNGKNVVYRFDTIRYSNRHILLRSVKFAKFYINAFNVFYYPTNNTLVKFNCKIKRSALFCKFFF